MSIPCLETVYAEACSVPGEPTLTTAAKVALLYVRELRDAWSRGVLSCSDGNAGLRSNLNVDIETILRNALDSE